MRTLNEEISAAFPRTVGSACAPAGTTAVFRTGITSLRRQQMARGSGGNTGGIGLGGILVIVGIVVLIVWSFWLGLIIALVGLIAFGGFAKGKWY
jgi:hypothetical protein